MEILPYVFAVYGICFGLMNDKMPGIRLGRRIGFFDRMWNCSYCTGFHSGWMVGLVHEVVAGFPASAPAEVATILVWGFGGAGFCYVVDAAAQWLETTTAAAGDK